MLCCDVVYEKKNVTDFHTFTLNNKQMISLSEAGMYVMWNLQ